MSEKNKYLHLRRQKYTDTLEAIAEKNAKELVSRHSNKEDAYQEMGRSALQGLEDQDIYSMHGLEARGAIHAKEAFGLVRALLQADKKQMAFKVMLTVASMNSDGLRYSQVESELSRAALIARLEWISSLGLGDDPDAWREWMEMRQEEGFFVGHGFHGWVG